MLAWEVAHMGETPYGGLDGTTVIEMILNGGNLLFTSSEFPVWLVRLAEECWSMEACKRPEPLVLADLIEKKVWQPGS